MRFAIVFAIAALAGACTDDVDEQWVLDHERIIAVRATPPSIPSGAQSTIDGLLGHKGAPVEPKEPEAVIVVSPASLSDAVSSTGGHWVVTAPSEDRLAAARTELKLKPTDPVPLTLGISYEGQALVGTKVVRLGVAQADNPTLPAITFNGADAPPDGAQLPTIDSLVKVPVSVALSDEDYDVNWLTGVGTMHDFDLPAGYIKVEKDDPLAGQFALVVRDGAGGVAWRVWGLMANPAPVESN